MQCGAISDAVSCIYAQINVHCTRCVLREVVKYYFADFVRKGGTPK